MQSLEGKRAACAVPGCSQSSTARRPRETRCVVARSTTRHGFADASSGHFRSCARLARGHAVSRAASCSHDCRARFLVENMYSVRISDIMSAYRTKDHCVATSRSRPSFDTGLRRPCRAADATPHWTASRSCEIITTKHSPSGSVMNASAASSAGEPHGMGPCNGSAMSSSWCGGGKVQDNTPPSASPCAARTGVRSDEYRCWKVGCLGALELPRGNCSFSRNVEAGSVPSSFRIFGRRFSRSDRGFTHIALTALR